MASENRKKSTFVPKPAMVVHLHDVVGGPDDTRTVRVQVEQPLPGGETLWISADGYEDAHGSDYIIGLEVYDGRLRLLVWGDINRGDPRIIDMEGALESARKERDDAN
jgi:hypothetical protein